MTIDIEPLEDDDGIRVTDRVENAQFELYTARPVDLTPTNGSEHYFPVDAAVRFEASSITIPRVANVVVRDGSGTVVAENPESPLPDGEYYVEVRPTPTRTCLYVLGGLGVTEDADSSRLDFGGSATVSAGFRSLGERPAGTITTPADPESLMDAVSLLGSSLATTSPERSFPTLRGHPPLIELGETFEVPSMVTPVDTNVRIVVPEEYPYVFASASLAHYLAADVVPGSSPRIEGDGWEYALDGDFETRASRVLRQTFFLDCIVRTEGFYPVNLRERRTFGVDLDCSDLYDRALDARLREYLEIPYAEVEPLLPRWSLTTDVQPTAERAPLLPYLAADLSLIRCPECVGGESAGRADPTTDGRSETSGAASTPEGRKAYRPDGEGEEFVRPDPVDTVEHAWVGDGVPLGANKATPDAYRRRVDQEAPSSSHISVAVVCNDDRMREEGRVADLYGLRDMLQFEIEVRHDTTHAELHDLLESDVDFLHYIGHVDERGMQCADGFFDLTEVDVDVGVKAFLLNACQSYRQGQAIVDGGSRGGIVTLADIANSSATRLGRIIARLMNGGFNLRTALHVAQRALITGHQYSVLGDGGVTLCQSRSGAAAVYELRERDEDDAFDLHVRTYPLGAFGTGTLFTLSLDSFDEHCLVPSSLSVEAMPKEKVSRLLGLEVLPVFSDHELHWSDELLPL